jgi:cell division protein FtsB
MRINSRVWREIKSVALALFLCVLIAFFSHQAMRGQNGLDRRAVLEAQISGMEAEIAALEARRRRLEHDIALLSDSAGEGADLTDEQARALFNLVRPGETVIINVPTPAR